MCIIDFVGLDKFINLRCHSVLKQPIELFFRGVERAFHQLEVAFRQLKERFPIQDLILGAPKHDCFQDNLAQRRLVKGWIAKGEM